MHAISSYRGNRPTNKPTDDTQVYVTMQASDQDTALGHLTSCIVRIRDWMASNIACRAAAPICLG